MSRDLGFVVHIVPPVHLDDTPVSSSLIRERIARGEIAQANRLLGREFIIQGRVIHGHHRGKGLGFPTANIKPEVKLHPPEGVYAAYCQTEDAAVHRAVMNIGYNPTFQDRRVSYELHVLDFDRDLYGEFLTAYIVDRLRPEMKFSDVEQLKAQIGKDVDRARAMLTGAPTMNIW